MLTWAALAILRANLTRDRRKIWPTWRSRNDYCWATSPHFLYQTHCPGNRRERHQRHTFLLWSNIDVGQGLTSVFEGQRGESQEALLQEAGIAKICAPASTCLHLRPSSPCKKGISACQRAKTGCRSCREIGRRYGSAAATEMTTARL